MRRRMESLKSISSILASANSKNNCWRMLRISLNRLKESLNNRFHVKNILMLVSLSNLIVGIMR